MDQESTQGNTETRQITLSIFGDLKKLISCSYKFTENGLMLFGELDKDGNFVGAASANDSVKTMIFFPYSQIRSAIVQTLT